jgi:hypothetical protein
MRKKHAIEDKATVKRAFDVAKSWHSGWPLHSDDPAQFDDFLAVFDPIDILVETLPKNEEEGPTVLPRHSSTCAEGWPTAE